jgi:uncharacterized Zn finger protein
VTRYRSGWGWYPKPAPKRPPPAHGIKVKQAGATWWGQRWIDALERMSLGYSSRLARGRTYARAGRTHDLVIAGSRVTAKVTGSRATPYRITLSLARLSDATWTQAITAMAAKAQFAAELLAGQMPREIDDAFRAAGASIFPAIDADLVTECSCPDWANPCKHVAAAHYVLGEALDRDPFVLFELRGRTKHQVLDALRATRAGQPASRRARRPPAAGTPTVRLGKVDAAAYDRPRERLPVMHFELGERAAPDGLGRAGGAVLRQLGAPASWSAEASPAELLSPIVRAASTRARQIALAEPEAEVEILGDPEPATPATSPTREAPAAPVPRASRLARPRSPRARRRRRAAS